MIFLYILLAIIVLFVIILSIKVTVVAEYSDKITLSVKYLFFKFNILPVDDSKKKKKAKADGAEPAETEPAAEPKAQKRNIFKDYYDVEGVAGIIELVKKTANIMSGFFGSMFKHFIIDDLYLDLRICGYDAANTAVRYGKVSAAVFPALATICSTAKVKKYDANISPDFLADESTGEFYTKFHVRPIFVVNAGIVLAVRMFFGVLLKLMKAKSKQEEQAAQQTQQRQVNTEPEKQV